MRNQWTKTGLELTRRLTVLLVIAVPVLTAQRNPYVGDVPMSNKKTLSENLAASPIHTEFVKALHTTGVDQLLSGGGPYTVFAPTDDAFHRPQRAGGTIILNGDDLTAAIKHHIVAGKLSAKQLRKRIKKGHGAATLQPLSGSPLTVKKYGDVLVLTDAKGGTATVVTSDVVSKGGIMHVIDAVLMP